MKTYLPEDILALSDRLSMWHSLEVRVPLATPSLFELASRIPTSMKISLKDKKIILKNIARAYIPESVIRHKKQGFEAPMANWLRNDMKQYCQETLAEDKVAQAGIFNPQVIGKIVSEHMSGIKKNNKILFSLLIFSEWLNQNQSVSR